MRFLFLGLLVCSSLKAQSRYYTASEFPGTQFARPILKSDDSMIAVSDWAAKEEKTYTRHEQLSAFPVIKRWNGFDLGIGGGMLYTRPLSPRHQFNLRLSTVTPKLKPPNSGAMMELIRTEAEIRQYLNSRWYISITAGFRRMEPNARLLALTGGPGKKSEGYGSLGIGRKITDKVAGIAIPLSLVLSYSTEKDFQFARPLPSGSSEIEEGGFRAGLSFGF